LMTGKGSIDNYLQINVKNSSAGGSASSDLVASANNGTETVNFIDMGINSSGYTNVSLPVLGGANTAYLYAAGNDFVIGNATAAKPLRFFTGGTANANERMRIDGTGKVGIGKTVPTEVLDITGNFRLSGAIMPNNLAGNAGDVLQSAGAGVAPTWVTPASVASTTSWTLGGNSVAGVTNLGTTSNFALPFITNNTEKMRISALGDVGIGISTFTAANPEQLIVVAGTPAAPTDFQNVIVGKGNTNSYAQLNIQNTNAGTAASADVVATANNGNESVNFIDIGINSGSNTSTGVLGGANTAYLYGTGNDLVIGNSTIGKDLSFYTTTAGPTSSEKMRILSSGNVGINAAAPNSTFDVDGSMGNAIATTATNLTLDATHYTLIITGGTPTITLPAAAAGNARRTYVLVNETGGARNIGTSTYKDFAGANASTVAANSSITIQSNGTNWYRIR